MDETTSLNCSHQRAYCPSPRWYLGMEDHGGWCRIGKTADSSLRALSGNSTNSHIVANQKELGEESVGFCLRKVSSIIVEFFYMSQNLRHVASGFTSPPVEGVIRIVIVLKNPSPRPGLNLWTLGPMVSTLTSTPPRRTFQFDAEAQACLFLLTPWCRNSSKFYLRIQSVPDIKYNTSPLQRSDI
jgi:hypothetical protein